MDAETQDKFSPVVGSRRGNRQDKPQGKLNIETLTGIVECVVGETRNAKEIAYYLENEVFDQYVLPIEVRLEWFEEHKNKLAGNDFVLVWLEANALRKYQYDFDAYHQENIMVMAKSRGLYPPVVFIVEEGKTTLYDGHHRVNASLLRDTPLLAWLPEIVSS